MSKRRAFTLVELLVVIGIIALLIAILLPAMRRAKDMGNRIVCATNLRSLATSFQMYTTESRGWFPLPGADLQPEDWVYWQTGRDLNKGALVPYTGKYFKEAIYRCPADSIHPAGIYAYSYTVNYMFTGYLGGTTRRPPNWTVRPCKMQSVYHPAEKILLIDESELTIDDAAWAPDHYFSDLHNQLSNRHDKNDPRRDDPKYGRGNVVYADGHYEFCERWKSFDPYYNNPTYRGMARSK